MASAAITSPDFFQRFGLFATGSAFPGSKEVVFVAPIRSLYELGALGYTAAAWIVSSWAVTFILVALIVDVGGHALHVTVMVLPYLACWNSTLWSLTWHR